MNCDFISFFASGDLAAAASMGGVTNVYTGSGRSVSTFINFYTVVHKLVVICTVLRRNCTHGYQPQQNIFLNKQKFVDI